ncbi:hypothetical protein AB0F71_25440 [Kitasatospora sp. NPDC028055]|uniref:hypothetical protein n=1 Tax=Kitasatospora sp. NPDC028055 TaxID=3155653 RepID=UPI0033ECE74C
MKDAHEELVSQRMSAVQRSRRQREEGLAEMAVLSRARLIARWAAAGLNDDLSSALADDPSVGRGRDAFRDLPQQGVVVLEGDYGSGKSVTVERLHQTDIEEATEDRDAPLPLYLSAREVAGPLQAAVARMVEALGDPSRNGVRLILDGLDEAGASRGADLLTEARVIAKSWPHTRILATARPGLDLLAEERITHPVMSYDEAMALARRVGGPGAVLYSESEAVSQALLLPLFVIIASLDRREGRAAPRSRVDFLDDLVARALRRPGADHDPAQSALERLAVLTIEAGGRSRLARSKASRRYGSWSRPVSSAGAGVPSPSAFPCSSNTSAGRQCWPRAFQPGHWTVRRRWTAGATR